MSTSTAEKKAALKVKKAAEKKLKPTLWQDIKRNPWLYGLCVPAIAFFVIFSYIPMAGLYIAFVDYRPMKGIWASDFVGIENFKAFFATNNWITVTVNTLWLNVLFITFTTITSVIIAIMLSGQKPTGWDQVLEEYNNTGAKETGVKLDVEWVSQGDYKEKLNLRMIGSENYDLVFDAPFNKLKTFTAYEILPDDIYEYKKYDLKPEAYYESPLAGFTFDTSMLQTETSVISGITSKVSTALEHGALDNPVEVKQENTAECLANGLDVIREEAKRQINEFLKQKNSK